MRGTAKILKPRRGWSTADAERAAARPPMRAYPKIDRPVFNGVGEMRRFEDALASTERLDGEELHEYMARVAARAAEAGAREPGQEG